MRMKQPGFIAADHKSIDETDLCMTYRMSEKGKKVKKASIDTGKIIIKEEEEEQAEISKD